MPIIYSKLIAAPMLQDLLVDKLGIPMANGTVTCYHDLNRTTLKNWYYLTGSPGNYTYTTLPNPLTLSAAGTICDINGVDTIPFFYPYLETDNVTIDTYFISIVSADGLTQITRQNFPPFPGSGNNPIIMGSNFNNLIVNGGFWRNFQPNTLNVTPTSITLNNYKAPDPATNVQLIVAPSQHDGFSFPDIQFLKNNVSATDILTFLPFPLTDNQVIMNDTVPEYYINHVCESEGTGETQKCYQFPIALHINNLVDTPYTVSIQAQNGGAAGGAAGTIQLRLLQYTGTGTTSPSPMLIAQTELVLTTAWATYILTDVFPPTAGLVLGQGSDDAYYLQVWMPFNTPCTINFTKPCLYLTQNQVVSYEFATYDQVDAIINSPRTGDIRTSLNQFYFYGWIPMNNGFIGQAANGQPSSYARANVDVWPLYNLIWNYAKTYDTGNNFNPIAQMFTNTGAAFVATNYGTSAYADFTANGNVGQAIALTQMMGRALLGTVPVSALLGGGYQQTVVSFTSDGGSPPKLLVTITNGDFPFVGMPVAFVANSGTLPTTIQANAVYYVTNINSNTFHLASTYILAIAGTPDIAPGTIGSVSAVVNMEIAGVAINNSPTPATIGSAINTGSVFSNFYIKL